MKCLAPNMKYRNFLKSYFQCRFFFVTFLKIVWRLGGSFMRRSTDIMEYAHLYETPFLSTFFFFLVTPLLA